MRAAARGSENSLPVRVGLLNDSIQGRYWIRRKTAHPDWSQFQKMLICMHSGLWKKMELLFSMFWVWKTSKDTWPTKASLNF